MNLDATELGTSPINGMIGMYKVMGLMKVDKVIQAKLQKRSLRIEFNKYWHLQIKQRRPGWDFTEAEGREGSKIEQGVDWAKYDGN